MLVPRKQAAGGSNPQASDRISRSDGTANLYLTLAAIIGAGLDGLKAKRQPVNVATDPDGIRQPSGSAWGFGTCRSRWRRGMAAFRPQDAERWFAAGLVTAYMACRRRGHAPVRRCRSA